MKTLKQKLIRELRELDDMESRSSGDISNEAVDMAYKAAKTLHYLCKVEPYLNKEHHTSGDDPSMKSNMLR